MDPSSSALETYSGTHGVCPTAEQTNTIPGSSTNASPPPTSTEEAPGDLRAEDSSTHSSDPERPLPEIQPPLLFSVPESASSSWKSRAASHFASIIDFKAWNGEEPSKEVCSNSKASALWHFALFHLPAVSVTLLLLNLYVWEARWGAFRPTPDELNALQYAAKAHESFILISITDILLQVLNFSLLQGNGIPLGFMTSAFHLGSPVGYLFSWEFWGTALNPTTPLLPHTLTSMFIVFLVILGLGAGPFSATLMIPRQGWWEFPLFDRESEPKYVLSRNPFQTDLTSAHDFRCNFTQGDNECIYMDLNETLQSFVSGVCDHPVSPYQANISYDSIHDQGGRPITLSVIRESEIAYATCPMGFITASLIDTYTVERETTGYERMLLRSQPQALSDIRASSQPLVAIECQGSTEWAHGAEPAIEFTFTEGLFDSYIWSPDLTITANLRKNLKKNSPPRIFDPIFLDTPRDINAPISAAILMSSSYPEDLLLSDGDVLTRQVIDLTLCLVQARWVEAEVWIDVEVGPSTNVDPRYTGAMIQSDLGFSAEDTIKYLRDTSTTDNVIKMHDDFLQGISIPLNGTINTTKNPMYTETYRFCKDYLSPCHQVVLGLFLADTLARSGYTNYHLSRDLDSEYRMGSEDILIETVYYWYGYAYRFQGRASAILSFSALLSHVCIVSVHLAIILMWHKQLRGTSWGGFGQILVLALQSKPPRELKGVSGGVESSQTWKRTVVVRDVGGKGRLHLLLNTRAMDGEQTDGSSVIDDGDSEGENASGGFRLVKAKVKYF
ncbi:hypothetical protein EDB81DRAFT_650767 [Dactylonectria macrodidyma]|uniref:Uncharacterized protein n=1 Tax=Dactylonectria macrodidyma TaxID=307937 RepID=A0A9P9EX93_9HYPO|nr:hypothetical protein EDB81DRAFT_650767 [Dactylonectria macrodidyma]